MTGATLLNGRAADVSDIAAKVDSGERITCEDALRLLECPDLGELSRMADQVRRRLHPEPVVTYIVGRNINYTNVCWVRCKFCAFYRPPGDPEGYVLPDEEIFRKIQEMVDVGGIEILLQGGLNSTLKLGYFERLFREIKRRFPGTHLHALSPAEILYLAKMSRLSVRDTLLRLREAGMDTLPGAGGEILVDEVRQRIAFRKDTADEWIGVMRDAHSIGMRTSATMMYGSVESLEDRVEHLRRIRELQDETGGFTAFIAWNFQPDGTELAREVPVRKTGAVDYLRTIATARIFLDNIPNIQASWVTQGPKIGQISLSYGVNDFGSTMLEENVVSAAGTTYRMTIEEIERLIRDAGYQPRRRNTLYQPV